jgi:hypothetical protein
MRCFLWARGDHGAFPASAIGRWTKADFSKRIKTRTKREGVRPPSKLMTRVRFPSPLQRKVSDLELGISLRAIYFVTRLK